jgi:hypothetical protein
VSNDLEGEDTPYTESRQKYPVQEAGLRCWLDHCDADLAFTEWQLARLCPAILLIPAQILQAVAQGHERAVYGLALPQPLAGVTRVLHSLTACRTSSFRLLVAEHQDRMTRHAQRCEIMPSLHLSDLDGCTDPSTKGVGHLLGQQRKSWRSSDRCRHSGGATGLRG